MHLTTIALDSTDYRTFPSLHKSPLDGMVLDYYQYPSRQKGNCLLVTKFKGVSLTLETSNLKQCVKKKKRAICKKGIKQ